VYSNFCGFSRAYAHHRFSSPAAPERPSTGNQRRLAPTAGSLQPLPVYSSPSSLFLVFFWVFDYKSYLNLPGVVKRKNFFLNAARATNFRAVPGLACS
jgi:hypothetical protein